MKTENAKFSLFKQFKIKYILIFLVCSTILSCNTNKDSNRTYIVEILSFKYKRTINASDFWKEDSKVLSNYSLKQPGFISRESGFNEEKNEVLIVLRWNTAADAEASMRKFLSDKSISKFVNMIDLNSMKVTRYVINK
ncbi:hypothetical protein [Algibacter sp. L4_22]|uniref:hypothetical protein n=1 Tax=Algibacter sp. L4_22 TaxID=2942477 RepID=UPI00201B90E7|nr:hypothetical protein [Algibacter sp. L4_22]MCL5129410.1 hypothetical protein [Algibacter sp. L4_22]